jgi:hypothetical protein
MDLDTNTEQRLIRLTHPLLNTMCSSIISTLLLNLGYQIWEEKLNRSKGIKIDRKNSNKIDNTLINVIPTNPKNSEIHNKMEN